MSEERLMKTPEEVRQKARELLQTPKVEILTKYMFQEQEIERLNNIINKAIEYINEKSYSNISKNYEELQNGQIEDLLDILKGVVKK